MSKLKVVFLGTNGWFDTATGNTICTFINSAEANILLDAGIGIYKLERYIDMGKPLFIFLSHLHLDHLFGFHIFNAFKLKKTVNIIVPKGAKRNLLRLVNRPFTIPFSRLNTRVIIKEAVNNFDFGSFKVKPFLLRHSGGSYGYRLMFNDKVIAYCPDTGYCENAIRLSKDADLLIAESAFLTRPSSNKWGHLIPEDAALIAKKANVRRLVLTHFDAVAYKFLRDRKKAQKRAGLIFKNTISAVDGLKISA